MPGAQQEGGIDHLAFVPSGKSGATSWKAPSAIAPESAKFEVDVRVETGC